MPPFDPEQVHTLLIGKLQSLTAAERARLRQAVQGQSNLLDKVGAFLPNLTERFKKVVDELGVVTQSQVDKARGILRELVGGQILLHPASNAS